MSNETTYYSETNAAQKSEILKIVFGGIKADAQETISHLRIFLAAQVPDKKPGEVAAGGLDKQTAELVKAHIIDRSGLASCVLNDEVKKKIKGQEDQIGTVLSRTMSQINHSVKGVLTDMLVTNAISEERMGIFLQDLMTSISEGAAFSHFLEAFMNAEKAEVLATVKKIPNLLTEKRLEKFNRFWEEKVTQFVEQKKASLDPIAYKKELAMKAMVYLSVVFLGAYINYSYGYSPAFSLSTFLVCLAISMHWSKFMKRAGDRFFPENYAVALNFMTEEIWKAFPFVFEGAPVETVRRFPAGTISPYRSLATALSLVPSPEQPVEASAQTSAEKPTAVEKPTPKRPSSLSHRGGYPSFDFSSATASAASAELASSSSLTM